MFLMSLQLYRQGNSKKQYYKLKSTREVLWIQISQICPKSLFLIIQTVCQEYQYRLDQNLMRIKSEGTVYAYSIILCMGSFVFGYELTSFSSLLPHILNQAEGETKQANATVAISFNFAFGVSTLLGIFFYNYFKNYGWRLTFLVTDALTIIAALIGATGLSISSQMCSRILFGVVTGVNTILIPIFLTSILPGRMGAPAGTLNQVFIVLGIFIGLCTSYFAFAWRTVILLPILPALIREWCLKEYFPFEALEVYMENGQNEPLSWYVSMIYEDITVDGFKEYKQLTEKDIEEENTSLWHHSNIAHRFRMIVAVAIAGFNQLSGGAALAYYVSSSHFFPSQNPDQQSLAILILINLLQLVVTVVAGQMIERYGRRAFMQEGQKIIIITLFMIGFLIIVAPEHKELILMLVFIHMVGFSLSYGPCTFLIGTEIVNDIFYPALTQWVLITFNLTVVGYLVDLFGLGALCLFYCLTQILSFVFLQSYQVQTKGKLRKDVFLAYREGRYLSKERSKDTEKQLQFSLADGLK